MFEVHVHHRTRPLVSVNLHDIGPKKSIEGADGTIAVW